jgi:predicted alpha/beta superfamily hydrolase
MKKISLIIFLATINIVVNAQNEESILIGKKSTIFSTILKENRKIWIYNPSQTAISPIANKRYPVVYVLDGDAHFLSTLGIIQQLSQANGNTILPEMIVVGIENTNRLRDLTPSLVTADNNAKVNPFENFLERELLPYVDKNYNTAPYRILVGHSLGGLTAIDILTNSPKLFNAYIAIDPSMWYDDEKFLTNTVSQIRNNNLQGTRLFIGTANTMPIGMTLANLENDRSAETQHIRSIFNLDKFIKGNSNTGLKYLLKYYENESHISVPLISEYDGLRFIFDYYLIDITERDINDSTSIIATKYRQHYNTISNEMGYKNAAPEAFINYLGYDALLKKQYSRAEALFQLNIENYPNSNNVYDSYADYLIAKHDSINAITYFKKALAIKNDVATQSKLIALTHPLKFDPPINELEKYAGAYILETYKIDVNLEIREGKLMAKVQGQEDDELTPVSKNIFTVKNKQGYTITFQMSDSRAVAFTSIQPNGIFKATLKK